MITKVTMYTCKQQREISITISNLNPKKIELCKKILQNAIKTKRNAIYNIFKTLKN